MHLVANHQSDRPAPPSNLAVYANWIRGVRQLATRNNFVAEWVQQFPLQHLNFIREYSRVIERRDSEPRTQGGNTIHSQLAS